MRVWSKNSICIEPNSAQRLAWLIRVWSKTTSALSQLPRSGWSVGRAGLGAKATYPAYAMKEGNKAVGLGLFLSWYYIFAFSRFHFCFPYRPKVQPPPGSWANTTQLWATYYELLAISTWCIISANVMRLYKCHYALLIRTLFKSLPIGKV